MSVEQNCLEVWLKADEEEDSTYVNSGRRGSLAMCKTRMAYVDVPIEFMSAVLSRRVRFILSCGAELSQCRSEKPDRREQ